MPHHPMLANDSTMKVIVNAVGGGEEPLTLDVDPHVHLGDFKAPLYHAARLFQPLNLAVPHAGARL